MNNAGKAYDFFHFISDFLIEKLFTKSDNW